MTRVFTQAARRQVAGVFMTTPALAMITVFFLIPLFMMVWMSFHDWPLLGEREFTGLQNYRDALDDTEFRDAVGFTIRYTLVLTPVLILLGLALALLVRRRRRGARFFQALYFTPVVIGFASGAFLWLFMFQPEVGPAMTIAKHLGVADLTTNWFAETASAVLVVVGMVTWKVVGLQMLLLLSGLQSVPTEVEEAAIVDGTSRWQRLRYVVLPLMRPTLALVLVFSVASQVLAFDQFYIMTGGGPSNSTITAVYEIYRTSFITFELGYGAALSALLMLALIVISAVQLLLLRSADHGGEE
jgi:multiple sugar transport system permease protein